MGIAKKLVRSEVARHPPHPGEARHVGEDGAAFATDFLTTRALVWSAEGFVSAAERFDEGCGDAGIIRLETRQHANAVVLLTTTSAIG
jgi:hypothetical protein